LLRRVGQPGHEVQITSDGRSLTLAPARKRYTLVQLLRGMKRGDMPGATWDAEPPAGREAW
jgi:antitoxin component of MazEF toxin-antitoxin module